MSLRGWFSITVCVALVVAVAVLGACSPEETQRTVEIPGEETTAPPSTMEETVRLSTTPEMTNERTTTREGALGDTPETPDVVLRIEGDPGTQFSGLCDANGRESVLSGQIPERFTFRLGGSGLSCEIQKQDEQRGNLKITLLAGTSTRSIQQTNTPGGTINITYNN